ncbi:MAG: T9SS type A sorting domain-containing protein [Bacteroidota bacterium]|nr:T9SS type A sorting domain-containing protein [Bacteroidota bacterium]
MKNLNLRFKIIIIISAFLISSKNIYSQWTIVGELEGVTGSRPQTSVVDANTAFVTGGSTVNATYKTTNGGTNWIQLNTGTLRVFYAIGAFDANNVFAGTDASGGTVNFYKTINGGINWTIIDSFPVTGAGIPGFKGIRFSNSIPSFGIAYAEGNNGDVYIYKTRNGGNIWTRTVLPGYPGFNISGGLNVIDSLFYAFGTATGPPSIIITTDGGVTWNLRDLNLPLASINITRGLAFKEDKLTGIAGSSSFPIIARTTNGGLNWVNINVGNNVINSASGTIMRWIEGTNICYLTASGSSIAGPITGVLKSTNAGLNWNPMTTSGLGINYMDTKRIGSNIYGYANSAVPGAFGGNVVLKLTDVIPPQQILYGDSITLGNGVVRTFVRVNALGRREQIGVSMTEGVMNNLPDTIIREFVLNLPAPVAADDTTFNHLFLTWNPDGHGPPGINEVPHFDFHFSTVSVAEREAVIPGIDPVYYPREFVPRDYLRDAPGVVPRRGLHWGDSTSMQTNENFTTQFIYTTYRGKRFSWAPGITRAYFLRNRDTIIAIKQAQLYRRAGRYPLNYSITHDPIKQTYDVVLRTFVEKEATTTNPFIGISNGLVNGFSETVACGSSITGGNLVPVDFDITASDWDVGDSVTLTASFSNPTGGSIITFTPSLPVRGNPARTHLHFVSNGEYLGDLTILATDRTGNTTQCAIHFDFPLPVELTSFVSTIHENDVTLNWTTTAETNNERFEIERRDARGKTQDVWNKIGFVQGHGNSTEPISYSFVDREINVGTYNYRLKQIDFNGNYTYHNLSNEVVIGVPTRFELSQNYPNPFNPKTIINYEIPVTNNVSIKVYDISGKEVATLVNEIQEAGYYAIDFDGSNFASGAYFYKLVTNGFTDTKRMILLK